MSYAIKLTMFRRTILTPRSMNRNKKMAIIGEKSIIPIGGMNFLKKPRYGSQNFANKRPKDDS